MKGRYEGTDPHVAALLGMTGRQGIFPLFSVIARRPAGPTWESVLLLAVWFVRACPGGHIGPPLRRVGSLREPTGLFVAAVWRRGGTEPAPYTMVEGMRFFPQRAANAQGALSEAGSAERGAGQFGLCPITEPCITAHDVRRIDGHSARGYVGGCLN